jgi:hypothetical protein
MSALDRPSESLSQWGDLTVAQRFAVLWDTLADVLGTAATATVLRRAMKQADGGPGLHGLSIERDQFSYGYTLPECWHEARGGAPHEALTAVIDALRPLLVELTGPVVIRRLERVGAFAPLGARGVEDRSVGETRP